MELQKTSIQESTKIESPEMGIQKVTKLEWDGMCDSAGQHRLQEQEQPGAALCRDALPQ
jgi:hypothetical protein